MNNQILQPWHRIIAIGSLRTGLLFKRIMLAGSCFVPNRHREEPVPRHL